MEENIDKGNYANCKFSYCCPLEWDQLKRTNNPDVRFCHECSENVYMVDNEYDFHKLGKEKKCVAVRKEFKVQYPPTMGFVGPR